MMDTHLTIILAMSSCFVDSHSLATHLSLGNGSPLHMGWASGVLGFTLLFSSFDFALNNLADDFSDGHLLLLPPVQQTPKATLRHLSGLSEWS